MEITLKSSAFENAGEIPTKYTCQGEDVSPPLYWKGVPETAQSLMLIVIDPDAPDPQAPKMTWVHWLLYNLPADIDGLAEKMTTQTLPTGTLEGRNDWGKTGYSGPCPPIGRHRYFHKLYALDRRLEDLHEPNRRKLEAAMQGHIIAQGELIGTYQK